VHRAEHGEEPASLEEIGHASLPRGFGGIGMNLETRF
jgi:hypothetical protein